MIDLSVLICSTHTRYDTFGRSIQDQVWDQYNRLPEALQDRIEILMLTDNKKMMLGHKRNIMVDAAQGRYVQFVDDDDRIEPDMFATLLAATDSDADAICFLVAVSLNGEAPMLCRYSIEYEQDRNTASSYERLPNHICCVKREIALQVAFPNIAYGEDSGYSKLLKSKLHTEHQIDRVLYHYDWNIDTTEAQQHQRAALRERRLAPIADVVILSDAKTDRLAQMTQDTINSCVAGANSLPINVMVVEQHPGTRYQHAETLRAHAEFNYNGFANAAARNGSAPWIVVANNDLVFHDGWLHKLLAVDHPLVSPKCPRDQRQADIVRNTIGQTVGRHMSGWCFMISRELWNKIGGFDECVSFWCSDNVVAEQCAKYDIYPMLVTDALVEHLGSVTLNQANTYDDLTYAQVEIFNQKYGRTLFHGNPGYEGWRQRRDDARFAEVPVQL